MAAIRGIAVVTGASRGIGAAAVSALASKGFLIAGISKHITQDALDALVSRPSTAPTAAAFACDVRNLKDLEQTWSAVRALSVSSSLPITAVVNCAGESAQCLAGSVEPLSANRREKVIYYGSCICTGITHNGLLVRTSDTTFQDTLALNFLPTAMLSKWYITYAMQSKLRGGSIVNIGSVVGSHGNAGQTAYAASKGAVNGT